MDIQKIWQEYRDQLRQFLRLKIDNPSEVDDLLQEILIKTYHHLNTIKEPDKLPAWLFQVTRNMLVDYYRKSGTERLRPNLDEKAMWVDSELDDDEHVRQELTTCIRPFLNQLPDPYREAIEAVDLQGASQKELAVQMGLSHSAIKSRVQRGRRMLKAMFQECCRYTLDVRGNLVDFEVKSSSCQTC